MLGSPCLFLLALVAVPGRESPEDQAPTATVETVGLEDAPLDLVLPDGPAVVGGPFSVRVADAAPGSQAFLALGLAAQPLFSEALGFVVYPAAPFTVSTAPVDAQGRSAPMLVTDKVEPELCGLTLTLQGAAADPGAPGLASTRALELQVGRAAAGLLPGWILQLPQRPDDFAAGDLDGDGLDELVLVNYPAAFAPPQSPEVRVLGFPAGAEPEVLFEASGDDFFRRPKLVDWNQDGRLDLTYLATTYSPTLIQTLRFGVMPGLGDGTFGAPQQWDLVKSAIDHALADLDGDGVLDLVYLGSTGSGLRFRKGTADGFAPPVFTPGIQGDRGVQLFLNDPDDDGDLDLLVHQQPILGGLRARSLANDGSGGFEEVARLLVDDDSARAGTLLAPPDGSPPALVFFCEFSPELRLVEVGPDLSLSFGRELDLDVPSAFSAPGADLEAADVDGDGRTDLVLADGFASVLLFRGREDGSLEELPRLDAVRVCGRVQPLRLNGDAALDLVASANGPELTLYYGRESVDFERHETLPLAGLPTHVGVGDVDGDGRGDAIATGEPSEAGEFPFLEVLLQGDPGVFESAQVLQLPRRARGLRLADFDGDGRVDVGLLRDAPAPAPAPVVLDVFLGTANGALQLLGTLDTVPNARALRFDDFDGDGRTDAMVLGFEFFEGSVLGLHPGLPEGGFGPPIVLAAGVSYFDLEVVDLDADGDADLLAPTIDSLEVWTNNGKGDFTVNAIDLGDGSLRSFVASDLDGDPYPDFVIERASPVRVEAYRGLPNGAFEQASPSIPLELWNTDTFDTGDVDGDGDQDLVLIGYPVYEYPGGRSVRIVWFENDGGGVFGSRHRALVPNIAEQAFDMALADLDENGTLDLLVARDGSAGLDLLANRLGHSTP